MGAALLKFDENLLSISLHSRKRTFFVAPSDAHNKKPANSVSAEYGGFQKN
jgi:hypothetical protein